LAAARRDAQGRVLVETDVVVLANASDALRLAPAGHGWSTGRIRGQLSTLPASALPCTLPTLPIAGGGYLLPSVNGMAVFGATSHRDDDEPALREADHRHNLRVLDRLSGRSNGIAPTQLSGRVGWRWATDDRLPLIGALPDATALGDQRRRPDQPRFVPRWPGLFVFGALGSRGITWSALGAQVLASQISGAPCPVESSLLDAVDPARFVSRAVRRGASAPE
jgi:tRNA 5-methylaminomethyl-2-thiouridine biosynthesis bifunctional protein